ARELDLERRDLAAAAVDELLLAADDLDHARLALAREVAGGEPAVADRLDPRLVKVAAHQVGAGYLELAVVAGDAEAHAWRGPPDAAGVARHVGGHEEEIAGRRFRQPVDVDERRRGEEGAQRLAEALAERFAADQHLPQRRRRAMEMPGRNVQYEAAHHGRHHRDLRRARVLEVLEEAA